jgi:hypothetical protein
LALSERRGAPASVRSERQLVKLIEEVSEGRHGGNKATVAVLLDEFLKEPRSSTTIAGYARGSFFNFEPTLLRRRLSELGLGIGPLGPAVNV